jgi:hypothetical protein
VTPPWPAGERPDAPAAGNPSRPSGAAGRPRLAFLRALDEAEAEEDGGYYDAGYDDGPWDDQARLEAIGDRVDDTYQRNATRIGEDIVAAIERRPSTESRLASAMARIQAGTYTEPGYFQPAPDARDPLGRYAAACGAIDDYGRCASRFHAVGCHVITEEAASTSTPEAVEAWRDTLAGHTLPPGVDAEALSLASPSTPEPWGVAYAWSDLLHNPEPGPDTDVRAWTLHRMGEADQPPPPPRPDLPDVTVLRNAGHLRRLR